MKAYRRDLSNGAVLPVKHQRFHIINTSPVQSLSADAVFSSSDGERFAIASANDRAAADDIALRLGSRGYPGPSKDKENTSEK
jgi:hypothetical protein